MADAAVETPQTASTEKDLKSANDTKTNDTATNGDADHKKTDDVTDSKASNGDNKADRDDQHERNGSDKRDRRDRDDRHSDRRDDRKRREWDDRGDRGRRNDRGRGGRGGGRGRGGRGGRGGYDNRNNGGRNVKTRFERKEESSDATEIRRQVEFYFSDSNLPIDKYLLEETGGSDNRPFPLKTIHQFKRMRHFQPFSAIVEAVKGSDFLEVNDKDEVYRKVPLDTKFSLDVKKNNELLTSGSMARSIYAKGFGDETSNTAFEIEEFFEPYGVRGVRLRRQEDGTFKGSVFVEFESEEAAQQFLEMDDKPKFKETELEIMSKKDYVDKKSQAILDGTVKPRSPTRRSSYHHNNNRDRRGSGNYKRKRDYDDDDDNADGDWRERREKFQKNRRASPSYESRNEKKDDEKADAKTEEKKSEDMVTESKTEGQKPEEAKAEEAKVENES